MAELDDLIAEYEAFRSRTINWWERLGDWFGGTDERLDYIVLKMLYMLVKMNQLNTNLAPIPGLLEQILIALGGNGGMIAGRRIQMIPYTRNVLPLTAVRMTEIMPFNGHVVSVTIHWPDGCDGFVDVMAGHSNIQYCPWDGALAFNDAWPQFGFMEPVNQEEEIWVDIGNADIGFAHTISVVVIIQEVL